MLNLDHTKFFDGFRAEFGPIPSSEIVHNLEIQLEFVAEDPLTNDPREFAYMLGTEARETRRGASVFAPIEEFGGAAYFQRMYSPTSPDPHRAALARANGMRNAHDAQLFHGNGYVQLTWLVNYKKFTTVLKEQYGIDADLVEHPELARVPEYAYRIMSAGMHLGLFTGHAFKEFITATKTDYTGARKIINPGELKTLKGRKVVAAIAKDAEKFEKIIREALV